MKKKQNKLQGGLYPESGFMKFLKRFYLGLVLAWGCILGFLIPVLFLLSGLSFVAERQNGSGLLMFGAWLLLLSCQETQFDVK